MNKHVEVVGADVILEQCEGTWIKLGPVVSKAFSLNDGKRKSRNALIHL